MGAGRPKNIESPEQLLMLFKEYQDYTKANPKHKHDFVGKDANEVYRELEVPLTWWGFECFLYDREIINDLGDYEKNKDGRYTEYAPIISRIKTYIRTDQYNGGATGIYQHNIIARTLGLVEATNNVNSNVNMNTDLTPEEAKAIAKGLEDKV